jgi:two-component system chemotaxis response regulator CheY
MQTSEISQASNRASQYAINILVADDSMSQRGFLSTILNTEGFAVTTAVDGLSAYEIARKNAFDLIITDHNMPHMNGVELITSLRALPEFHMVPMLVLTIETNEELKELARASGANGWIVKPVRPATIVSVVHKLLAAASPLKPGANPVDASIMS